MIAEVIVNSAATELNRVFDYGVPNNLDVVVGMRVLVPFGYRKQNEIGYVVGLKEKSEYKCKNIIRIVENVFDEKKLELAKWMSEKYFCNLSEIIKLLVPPGTSSNVDGVKDKIEKWVSIKENADLNLIKNDKQKRIIDFLLDNLEAPVNEIIEYTDTTSNILKTLEKNGLIEFKENRIFRNPFKNKDIKKTIPFELNNEQRQALESIDINKEEEYLLFGVTGSGKTEVYLQLIQKVLESGKNAILLVPEISLTPQITDRFLSRFGNTVAILHSRLSKGERYDEWQKINKGECRIVIGARSAIFAPLKNLGVIIIDEEHDQSYKSETMPKYDARDVARKMSKIYNIPIVLGSATPDIRTYYLAKNKKIKLLELKNRISSQGMPEISIVDMRQELATNNKTPFSRKLYFAIKEAIAKGEQTMLFLNRRGYSTFIMCRDCGYVVKCNDCDVSMTYHLTENKLMCHYCGKTTSIPSVCPECNSNKIKYFGTGTQKIEQELKKYLPEASIIRMDVDTTKTKNAHENILKKFKEEKINVLLGTQMIAKGHDFANVTLVGVLAADGSINIGDYKANERTYQLLTQVSGRAGRGDKKGQAIIQTYVPDEFCIQASKEQNYENFYNTEIIMREKLNYPPFCDIIVIGVSGLEEEKVKNAIKELYNELKDNFNAYMPAPAPIAKINSEHRWRILIKEQMNDEKNKLIGSYIEKFLIKKQNVKLSVDINPNNMM